MKIQALETFLDGHDRFVEGDIRTVLDEDGRYYCSLGWAQDVDGKVATGERPTGNEVRLDIRGAKSGVTSNG